ncbi:hypothetical protein [Lysinibacillus sphaericus]|uniref:Uncharacterized protein n=1 Tax=Lysinibacillus sphaericus OT4b.31 TaxID=1285586 RepID=R7ZIR9_LYSSH|nr:hypothetical protein [Lysinibacillus sphaericus]EON73956.1 hypothetical protein H131_04814 [Lysinibacillus sphaericus OT4b.31]
MNSTTISEEFGEQLAIVTAGTPYEIGENNENFFTELEHRIRRVMYSLWMDGQAQKLANYLQKKQAAHMAELYEFSYGVPMYDNDYSLSSKTETLALMIIDEKKAYAKRIQRIRLQYERFKKICNQLNDQDQTTLKSYFEHNQKVDYELLRTTIQRNLKLLEQVYKDAEAEKDNEFPLYHVEVDAEEQHEEDERKRQNIYKQLMNGLDNL